MVHAVMAEQLSYGRARTNVAGLYSLHDLLGSNFFSVPVDNELCEGKGDYRTLPPWKLETHKIDGPAEG